MPSNKVTLFGGDRFVAVGSYVNGDLVVYNLHGRKMCQKKGNPKSVVFVDKKETLMLCGCKNGLL